MDNNITSVECIPVEKKNMNGDEKTIVFLFIY